MSEPSAPSLPSDDDASHPSGDLRLPEPVRQRVITLASDALGALPAEEVPSSLRPFVRFTPHRRRKLAASPVATALETDGPFRAAVGARVRTRMPDLVDALGEGVIPAAADPVDVAAVAYIVRPAQWQRHVAAAAQAVTQATTSDATAQTAEALRRLQEQLALARATARAETDRLRGELDRAKSEVTELRHKLYEARERLKNVSAEAAVADLSAEAARAEAASVQANADAELRRMKARLADAEQALEATRRIAREGRSVEDIRVRLLLDTVLDAAQGLRRELALPPLTLRPADSVAAATSGPTATAPAAGRALPDDDPVLLDQLLRLPQVHLVVDGYNVTKTGFGALPLEGQRSRLIAGLSALAAQSGAEVTCVFDGAALTGPVPSMSTRGVRVLFSKAGETADDLIRRLVRAEPAGRPVVVVTSDREVADGVQRAGARALAATALLRRLGRG